jgi:hypothetical protein
VVVSTTLYDHPHTGRFRAGETVVLRTLFIMRLAAGRYTLSPSVASPGSGSDVLDAREDMAGLLVHSSRHTGGVVDLEQVFEVQRP